MVVGVLSRVATGDVHRREKAKSFRDVAAAVRRRRKSRAGYLFNRAEAYDREGTSACR